MAIEGDLSNLALGDIFQTLGMSRQVGSLMVRGTGVRHIAFTEKGIALMTRETSHGLRIGDYLLGTGKIDLQQLMQALEMQKQNKGKLLGEILAVSGACSDDEVRDAARYLAAEELYAVIAWDEGTFEFDDGDPEEFGPFVGIWFDVASVVMEMARRQDEMSLLLEHAPAEEVFLHVGSDELDPERFTGAQRSLYTLLDGTRNVERAFLDFHLGRYDTWKALSALLAGGAIRPARVEELLAGARYTTEQGEYDKSASLYRRALQRDSTRDDIREAMAEAMAAEDKRHEAAAELVKVGYSFLDGNEAIHAIQRFKRACELDLQNSEAAEGLMRSRFSAGLIEDGLTAAHEATDRYLQANDHDGAVRVAWEGLEHRENDVTLLLALANGHLGGDRREQGVEALDKVVKELETTRENDAQLIEVFRQILRVEPHRTECARRISEIEDLAKSQRMQLLRKLAVVGGVILVGLFTWWLFTGSDFDKRLLEAQQAAAAGDVDGARAIASGLQEGDLSDEEHFRLSAFVRGLVRDAKPTGPQPRDIITKKVAAKLEKHYSDGARLIREERRVLDGLHAIQQTLTVFEDDDGIELKRQASATHAKFRTEWNDEVAKTFVQVSSVVKELTSEAGSAGSAFSSDKPFKQKNVVRLRELAKIADDVKSTCCSVDADELVARVEELGKLSEAPEGGPKDKLLEHIEAYRVACDVVEKGGARARALVLEKELDDRYFESYSEGQSQRSAGELEKAANTYRTFLDFCEKLREAEPRELYDPIIKQYLHDPQGPEKRTDFDRKHQQNLDGIREILRKEAGAADAEAKGDVETAYAARVGLIRTYTGVPFDKRFKLPVRVESLPGDATVFRTKMGGVEQRLGTTPLVVGCDVNGSTRLSLRLEGFEEAEFTHEGVDDPRGASYRTELPKLVRWRIDPDAAGRATPPALARAGVLLCSRRGVVRAIGLEDGKEKERFTVPAGTGSLQGVTAAPTVRGDRVHVITLDKQGYVLDASNLEQQASYTLPEPVRSTPVVVAAGVMALDQEGFLLLIDGEGKTVWRTEVGKSAHGPVAAGSRVVVVTRDGFLAIVDSKGEVEVRRELPKSPPWNRPTVHGGRVYCGSDGGWVVAYDMARKKFLWTVRADGPIRGGMHVDEKQVVVATTRGNVHSLARDTGDELARTKLEGTIGDGLLSLDDGVAVITEEGVLTRLDVDLVDVWRFHARDEVKTRPVLLGGLIVILTRTGIGIAVEP